MQTDLGTSAMDLININMEKIGHKTVMFINFTDPGRNIQKITGFRIPGKL
jgi:hypothetical protein